MFRVVIGCRALQICPGTPTQISIGLDADFYCSIFDAVITPIRKSLNLDSNAPIAIVSIDVGSNLMEVLCVLVGVQSKEQWLRFSLQMASNSLIRPSSKMKGQDH
jgi:hypothetical protein